MVFPVFWRPDASAVMDRLEADPEQAGLVEAIYDTAEDLATDERKRQKAYKMVDEPLIRIDRVRVGSWVIVWCIADKPEHRLEVIYIQDLSEAIPGEIPT